jgi:hypothetical protein
VKIPEHYEALMPAIEVGKKIFVEWAPGKNLAETLQLAETAKAKGIKSMVAAQGVYTAYARKVRKCVLRFQMQPLMMLWNFGRLKNSLTLGKSVEFYLLRL